MNTKKMALIFFGLSILCGKTIFAMEKEGKESYDYNVWFRKGAGNTFNEKIANGYSLVIFYEDEKFHRKFIGTIKEILVDSLIERNFNHSLQFITVPCESKNEGLKETFKFWTTPAYFVVRDGKIIAEESGTTDKKSLKKWLEKHINNN